MSAHMIGGRVAIIALPGDDIGELLKLYPDALLVTAPTMELAMAELDRVQADWYHINTEVGP